MTVTEPLETFNPTTTSEHSENNSAEHVESSPESLSADDESQSEHSFDSVDIADQKEETQAEKKTEPSQEEEVDDYSSPTAQIPPPIVTDGIDAVPGFNVVKATGLTDTSAPVIPKSQLPEAVTPSPIVAKSNSMDLSPTLERFGSPPLPSPTKNVTDAFDPISETPKSKIFAQRMDYMISEFFSNVFSQKIKERLGQHWAHVTAQPEVDAAGKEMDRMDSFFLKMEKTIEKQIYALNGLTEAEAECSLYFQQLG
jgi:hypothetical protein